MSDEHLIDQRTAHRKAARELTEITTLREHQCQRRHATLLEFAQCAIPNSTAQSSHSGEWVVASYCSDVIFGGAGPKFLMYPTFGSAARAYDNANVWSCYAEKCRGLHSIRLVIPS
ncbi:hypothetical protein [Rhodococcus opacus]|uniref:Uncharacterized protein n=1 Tax=Rhodococcus opacus TaxID=37919 RepID=A0A2S8JBX2_RHOOP|nr:hypothetical protein [Rhodococcus opacus]PQP24142.1 hypothetical protein C5613_14780 [Rhodococcus opacus]